MRKIAVISTVGVVALCTAYFAVPKFEHLLAAQEVLASPTPVASPSPAEPTTELQQVEGAALESSPPAVIARQIDGQRVNHLYGSVFEASLLTQGMVNDRALKLLEAKNFDQVVNQLDAQNAGQKNEVAAAYRKQVESTLASFGKQAQIDRFACGANVCVASVRTSASESWFNDWYENVQTAATMPVGALSEFKMALPGGVSEHRILFTTQPGSAGFFVKPIPRQAKSS